MTANHVTKHVLFAGRVQGVGFRQTAWEIAERFAIAGYVRNLPTGDVELVAQGEPAEIGGFLEALERRMSGYIRSREIADREAGDYEDFEIRH
jgi:acylphosphatase